MMFWNIVKFDVEKRIDPIRNSLMYKKPLTTQTASHRHERIHTVANVYSSVDRRQTAASRAEGNNMYSCNRTVVAIYCYTYAAHAIIWCVGYSVNSRWRRRLSVYVWTVSRTQSQTRAATFFTRVVHSFFWCVILRATKREARGEVQILYGRAEFVWGKWREEAEKSVSS